MPDQPWLTGVPLQLLLSNPSALMPGDEVRLDPHMELFHKGLAQFFGDAAVPAILDNPPVSRVSGNRLGVRIIDPQEPGLPFEPYCSAVIAWRRPSAER